MTNETMWRAWKTRALRLFGGSDRKRWSDPGSLRAGWDERTRMIASLIPPDSRVLEFGAGNCQLGGHLAPGCSYIPSDIVSRRPDCLVIDLNSRRPPPLPPHDVAAFSGVLEYVRDIGAVAGMLALTTSRVVASYAVFDAARGDSVPLRRKRGWVNDWDKPAFVSFFTRAGFELREERVWIGPKKTGPQAIFVFVGPATGRREV